MTAPEGVQLERVRIGGLEIAAPLHQFVQTEALPGSGVDSGRFWAGLDAAIHEFAPRNRELLARRAELQLAVDDYHRGATGSPADPVAYERFLREIGYLEQPP
ncbi:MAG: malate synthase G, partial [Jatrophihabitantaceae bacterium]